MSSHDHFDDDTVKSRPLSAYLILRVLKTLGPYKWLVFLGNILLIGCAWADLRIIREISLLVDRADLRTVSVVELAIPFLWLAAANRIFGISQYLVTVFATNRAMANLRMEFFDKLLCLPKRFFDQHKSGWLVARSTGDMGILADFMTFALMMLVYLATSMGYALTRIYAIAPILLVPCVITLPVAFGFTIWFQRNMSEAQREARRQSSLLTANLAENIRGVRVVQAFSREEHNLHAFNEINRDSHDMEIKVARLGGMFMPCMDFLGILNIAIVMILGAWLFHHPGVLPIGQALTPGDLVAYILYINVLLWPIRLVVQLYGMSLRAMAAAERIYEIIDLTPEIQDPAEDRTPSAVDGNVAVKNVTFAYSAEDSPVLKDFSLNIPAGTTLALVGSTGAGKTTIAALVARFYDVDHGSIEIDGVDVRDCAQDSLRRRLGIVPQEGFLFTGTVLDNLRFARPDMDEEAVIQSARDLGTHEVISSLPHGYNTVLGEGGSSISEGQRQLISVTRALVADPEILILDEPTSSLDSYTEQILQASLEKLMQKRTTIIIAHRLSTIRHADNIVILEDGRIVEQGSHDALIAGKGAYYGLVTAHGDSHFINKPNAESNGNSQAGTI